MMLKKLERFLAGLPMTIVAGVFLLLDLVPHLMEEFGGTPVQLSFLPFDPAWVTIVISGIPPSVSGNMENHPQSRHQQNIVCPFDLYRHVRRDCNRRFVCGGRSRVYHGNRRTFRGGHHRSGEKRLEKPDYPCADNGTQTGERKRGNDTGRGIRQGDVLRILPGETIPVDGTIISGETSVDQSIMTGESLPVDKGVGEEVFLWYHQSLWFD